MIQSQAITLVARSVTHNQLHLLGAYYKYRVPGPKPDVLTLILLLN